MCKRDGDGAVPPDRANRNLTVWGGGLGPADLWPEGLLKTVASCLR